VTIGDADRASRLEAVRLLEESRLLIARGWCQGALAIDEDSRRVEPWSTSARRWSPLGPLLRAWYESPSADAEAFRIAYTALANATGGRLEEWNAARWRARRHVLNAFGRARAYVPSGASRTRVTRDPPDDETGRAADPDSVLVSDVPTEPR
jgi:hypothetical protein